MIGGVIRHMLPHLSGVPTPCKQALKPTQMYVLTPRLDSDCQHSLRVQSLSHFYRQMIAGPKSHNQ